MIANALLDRLDGLATRERALRCAVLIGIALAAGFAVLIAGGSGTLDAFGRPIGTDFSNVYAAGRLVLDGVPAAAWDWPRHFAVQQQVHGKTDIPFYGWHYPPPFLIAAAAIAAIPYLPALLLWQASGMAAVAVVIRRLIVRPSDWIVALGFPAVLVCIGHGQNGFATAGLLGGAMLVLDRRPVLAGVLIGLIAYKPQFGVLLPIVLAVGGHWRAFAVAAVTVVSMAAVSTLVLGAEIWPAFARSLELTRSIVVEDVQTGAAKLVTPFAAIRLAGGGATLAWAVQFAAAAILIAMIAATRNARPAVRGTIAIAVALLATPYAFDYDMVVLGIAIAWLIRDGEAEGWRRGDRALLALAYCAPLFGRAVAGATGIPVNLLAIVGVLWVGWRRREARSEHRHPAIDVHRLTGDVSRLATGEVDHRRADILA